MAATRAAELTVAYKTLSDAALREEYDASIAAGTPPPHVSADPARLRPREDEEPAPPPADPDTPPPPPPAARAAVLRPSAPIAM